MASGIRRQNTTPIDWSESFMYDRDADCLIWRHDYPNRAVCGKMAGCDRRGGYSTVRTMFGVRPLHIVVWEINYGPIPPNMVVDHINRNMSDNRIGNLRLLTKSQNSMNSKLSRASSTGLRGVRKTKSGTWSASIGVGMKRKHIGTYATKGLAAVAYAKASVRYFGSIGLGVSLGSSIPPVRTD